MHKYYYPSQVTSPRDCVSNVVTVFDGGIGANPFSIALVTWNGDVRTGMRWNVTLREWDDTNKGSGSIMSVGEPNSRGYPTWFILPNELLGQMLSGKGEIAESVREALKSLDPATEAVLTQAYPNNSLI